LKWTKGEKLNTNNVCGGMGKCSYTWEEWDKEKGGLVVKRCPRETWGSSDEYCIFHDPSPEKDVDLFKEKLEEQLQSETDRYCFVGYFFPKGGCNFNNQEFAIDADFGGATFQDAYFGEATFQDAYFRGATFQDAYFRGATFQGTANFRGATFQGTANFRGATFQGPAYFWEATFQDAYFGEATFQGTANFWEATFQDAYFGEATFQGTANFRGATVENTFEFAPTKNKILDFQYVKFLFRANITADLTSTRFHRAYLDNVAFIDCIWPRKIYGEVHMEDEDIGLSYSQLETIYRDLKQNMQNHGDYNTAGKFYYREMEMRRKGSTSWKNRIWLNIYRIVGGYGEGPLNTAAVSGLIIILFALAYGISGCLQYTVQNPCLSQQIKDSIYFSFVTFTTLGLGDISPASDLGKFLICCEAVIGAFLIALFVVVFARKMMR
jgi:uncharacterized protein YjbI with pentapeptide repeats